MHLTSHETDLVFSIMQDLSGGFSHADLRRRVCGELLDLLKADYFVSYEWNEQHQRFENCVHINMTDDNLAQYEDYFRFCDPIIDALQRRKRATPVSAIMRHEKLARTEFFNDFLMRDGLCYGMNYYAYDRG